MTDDNNNKPSLKRQLISSAAMETLSVNTLAIHGLATLLQNSLDTDSDHAVQLPQQYLASLATAIVCLNRQTESDVEELVATAHTLSQLKPTRV